jgi:hypothetical protein
METGENKSIDDYGSEEENMNKDREKGRETRKAYKHRKKASDKDLTSNDSTCTK